MKPNHKPILFAASLSAIALISSPLAEAAAYNISIQVSSGPNQHSASNNADYQTYSAYARDALLNGTSSEGPDPATDPTGYEAFSNGQAIDPGYAIVSSIPSWLGQAAPTGAFAGQHGNRLKFGLHLTTTSGTPLFKLSDVTWTMVSRGFSGNPLANTPDTLGDLNDGGTRIYDGVHRYGVWWGNDGIQGTGDDVIYNNGESGDTMVNELVYFGLGRAWPENADTSLTDQERLDLTANANDFRGSTHTATFSIGEESASSFIVIVPEPSSALLGLLGMGLLIGRRSR